jgi:hypothetical protein
MTPAQAHKEIVEQIPDLFLSDSNKEFYSKLSNFDEEFFSWIEPESEVKSFSVREDHRAVRVIVFHPEEKKYSLIRFFPIGYKWETSVDLNQVDDDVVFNRLLG